jgi:hypothetical protein
MFMAKAGLLVEKLTARTSAAAVKANASLLTAFGAATLPRR